MAHLVFQVEARFLHFLSYFAFCIPHRIPHSISSFHHIACSCTWLIASLLLVCLLHALVLLPCEISGKMTIPSKSLLSLLASCSLFCYAAIPTTCYIMPPILPCQASNPPFLANRCLAMLSLLPSPSYSVASYR